MMIYRRGQVLPVPRMKVKLSKYQRYRLYDRPRKRAGKKLARIEKQIQAILAEQGWDNARRKMRGIRTKQQVFVIPPKLIRAYEKVLIDMVMRYRKNGRILARLRAKAYRKKVRA